MNEKKSDKNESPRNARLVYETPGISIAVETSAKTLSRAIGKLGEMVGPLLGMAATAPKQSGAPSPGDDATMRINFVLVDLANGKRPCLLVTPPNAEVTDENACGECLACAAWRRMRDSKGPTVQ